MMTNDEWWNLSPKEQGELIRRDMLEDAGITEHDHSAEMRPVYMTYEILGDPVVHRVITHYEPVDD